MEVSTVTTTTLATYERESTLWKNANAFYKMQDWTRMECYVVDYADDIAWYKETGTRWVDLDGNDVTEKVLNERYGAPYRVEFINASGTNSKTYKFKTREAANAFVKDVLNDRILKNFRRVK